MLHYTPLTPRDVWNQCVLAQRCNAAPAQACDSDIDTDDLISIVDQLSPRMRLAFNLYFFNSFTASESAQAMGVSDDEFACIVRALNRARRELSYEDPTTGIVHIVSDRYTKPANLRKINFQGSLSDMGIVMYERFAA